MINIHEEDAQDWKPTQIFERFSSTEISIW